MTGSSGNWCFWIDRGGTFTDVVAQSPKGELRAHKLLSDNPQHYDDAAIQGMRDILGVQDEDALPSHLISSIKMGTTVATNALLERRGEKTVFVTSRGLADVLRIGYQNRPDLFARHIVLPEMLYSSVIEIDERMGAHGEVVRPLDLSSAGEKLQSAFDEGYRCIAIALMHGYRYPRHEQALAQVATDIGYQQVSLSHSTSPLVKIVSRADTTVLDAYLSPILRRYINRVSDYPGIKKENGSGPELLFMQSSGGLTDARRFQGKDAILSGPAGGVVGMVKTAGMAGYDRLIGFDMGGTSTDVTHYHGDYERSFETQVAGVRLRAPMMHIHTVAAGGGSILEFDGSRFRVGPASAGADPGPACYRRGGPLTVTDCNVLLGRIHADYFPRVFGSTGNQPLDREATLDGFLKLQQKILSESQRQISLEDIAEGYLRIAVENMANAIKKISVQRGHDVTAYTLNCFGGAGGQHACRVADALGIERIFLHPLAGVLSAYGMGLADIRVIQQAQMDIALDSECETALREVCQQLAIKGKEEVLAQQVHEKHIEHLELVHIRYAGTDNSLPVTRGGCNEMQSEFESLHRQRFGFIDEARELLIESVSVETIGESDTPAESVTDQPATQPAKPGDHVSMWINNQWQDVPLYERDSLQPGHELSGPAIVVENNSTLVIEPGWQLTLNRYRHLLLQRIEERPASEAVGTSADPVMLEVFNNLFMSIAEQMGATLSNTAYSVNIKERLDFSCAIFSSEGRLVANAPHMPVHLGSMGESIKEIIRLNRDSMCPGNVYMLNDPYHGGTHLPDVTVITPVFDDRGDGILFYVASRGHHADIGGRTPGSSPPGSQHIDEEGVLINNFLLVEKGVLREAEALDLFQSGPWPCRNPEQNMADLKAQIAANETGVREVKKMLQHFGVDVVQAYMQHVQDNAAESVRRVLDVLSDGSFIYPMDDGAEIHVSVLVDRNTRKAVIDFTGTSPQSKGNYNAPLAVCKAAVLYVFRTLVDDDIPLNQGCLEPLDIRVPAGSMLNPEWPAAVVAGNTEVSQAIADALFAALGAMASSQGTMNNLLYGNQEYQNYETICGGTGAGPDHPGCDAVHSHMTNTRMTDPEVLEWRFPVRLEEFSIRRDSGGRGKHTGGNGVTRKLRFLENMTVTMLTSRRDTDPFGVHGGESGARGRNYLVKKNGTELQLSGNDEAEVSPGDMIVIETPGGGGFGK